MTKSIVLKLLTVAHKSLTGVGNWLHHNGVKLEIKTSDLRAKWTYKRAYMLGTVTEITTSIRLGEELPIKEVYIVCDGVDTYFVYDMSIHHVKQVSMNRVFNTREEASERLKALVEGWNSNIMTITEVQEEPVKEKKVKKGNGKRHIAHEKKQPVKEQKRGNGKSTKKTLTKKKVISKKGNK